MSIGDLPAFPRDHRYDGHNGITLRQYYAGIAMQGVLASDVEQKLGSELVAKWAVSAAEHLIAELEKDQS